MQPKGGPQWRRSAYEDLPRQWLRLAQQAES